jgi:hypothetical protein
MSAQMANALRGLGSEVTTGVDAIRELHADFGEKASGILAQAFGVTQRTGQRWIQWAEGGSSQKSNPLLRHPERARALIDLMRNRRAAKNLRRVRRVRVGKVKVWDKSPKKGRPQGRMDPRPRHIGTRPVRGTLATAVEAAADLVAQGEYERAAAVLDDGLLEAYGVPEDALQIESHLSPPQFEM